MIPGITHWHTALHMSKLISDIFWDDGLYTFKSHVLNRKRVTRNVKDYDRSKEFLDDVCSATWQEYLRDCIGSTTSHTGREVVIKFFTYAISQAKCRSKYTVWFNYITHWHLTFAFLRDATRLSNYKAFPIIYKMIFRLMLSSKKRKYAHMCMVYIHICQ
jgi:hypothetical protein